MADKEPCLCVPSCTKELGRVQRRRHQKRVQAALGHASDSSDAGSPSSANRDLGALPADTHIDSVPGAKMMVPRFKI
jgi:hypothetical protein